MELIHFFIDYFLHLDQHLNVVIQTYGVWTYLLLFVIIFCETGLVVMPILPGDSLLFAAGAFAALGSLDVKVLFVLLGIAAVAGDTVNYWIGHYVGPKVFQQQVRFLKKEYLDRTHAFFAHYGGKTIVLARFVPFVRTFAPFLAGVGEMHYGHFITYNVIGGVLWVALFLFGGFLFGRIPFVEHNLFLVLAAVVVITTIPIIVEYLRQRHVARLAAPEADAE
jgi:Uncharacterized membrane-associated protein